MGRTIRILLLLVVFLGAAGVLIAWQRLTRLPDWYHQPQANSQDNPVLSQDDFNEAAERDELEKNLQKKLAPLLKQARKDPVPRVKLNEQEISELIVVSAHQSEQTQPYLEGVKGIKTEVTTQNVKTEMVVNFSQIDHDRLPADQVKVLDQLATQFPLLADQEILLSFEGHPQIIEGQLQLDPATQVTVGGFQMTLTELLGHFGVGVEETPINLQLSDFVDIGDVEYTEGAVVVTGQS